VILIGSDTAGPSANWRESCDQHVRIPISDQNGEFAERRRDMLYEACR
jgi:hypothetical protein